MKRFAPTKMGGVRRLLSGLEHTMKVEIGTGVPLSANTVAALRALSEWPAALVVEIPREQSPDSVVKVRTSS